MPTIADILNARRRQSIFDRISSGSSSTAPAPEPPSIFQRLSQATSEPLPMEGRLSLLPAMVTPERGREWAVPGVLAGAWNAFTAPGRALQGQELGPEEALNVAGTAMLGGMPVARAAGVGGPGELGLNVFHGSPHKFDKFDISKIGTGEGNQAYGHGLYFAEKPGTAKAYQSNLSNQYKDASGNLVQHGDAHEQIAAAVKAAGSRPDDARKVANHILDVLEVDGTLKNYLRDYELPKGFEKPYMAALEKAQQIVAEKNKGSLYKVDLPDEQIAKMLDWDKPLSQQPAHIQEPIKKWWAEQRIYGSPDKLNGEGIHGSLMATYMGSGMTMAAAREAAAQDLRHLGIPGIKYLDQGSRGVTGTGKWNIKYPDGTSKVYDLKPNDDVLKMMGATAEPIGTSNFVVFSDDIPKILSRE